MTETIKLMKAHTSVRRFKEQALPQEDLTDILTAAQMASSWKNFQSYSVIVVRSQEKKWQSFLTCLTTPILSLGWH